MNEREGTTPAAEAPAAEAFVDADNRLRTFTGIPSAEMAAHKPLFAEHGAAVVVAATGPRRTKSHKLEALGRQALSTLYMLIRNVRMYDADNAIFAAPLEQLREVINTVIAVDGKFDLAAAGTQLALNGVGITIDYGSLENVRTLTNELKARDMGGLLAVRPVNTNELKAFLRAFASKEVDMANVDAMVNVRASRYRHIVEALRGRSEHDIHKHRKLDRNKYMLLVYARAVTWMRAYVQAIRTGQEVPPMPAIVRTIRDMVDVAMFHQKASADRQQLMRRVFMGVATPKDSPDALAYRAVNACVLSSVLAVELGLARDQAFDVARAALFHDVGIATAPDELLHKRQALTLAERAVLAQAPLVSAKLLLRARPIDVSALRAIVAAYEAKLSPIVVEKDGQWHMRQLGVLGRVIRVVSVYVSLTSERPHKRAMLPGEAIERMCTELAREFDPHLLAVFVQLMAGHTAA